MHQNGKTKHLGVWSDLGQVSPNSGFRIWCKILKDLTNEAPDKMWCHSSPASHWLDFSGYGIISRNMNLVKLNSELCFQLSCPAVPATALYTLTSSLPGTASAPFALLFQFISLHWHHLLYFLKVYKSRDSKMHMAACVTSTLKVLIYAG